MEFAEMLNYSDKAVSKWERGESIPDISVLKQISDIFNVTVDYLISEHTNDAEYEKAAIETEALALKHNTKKKMYDKAIITGLVILGVWLVATIVYVIANMVTPFPQMALSFVYALPISMIPWVVLNSCWFNKHRNYLIISIFMWTSLLAVFVSLLVFKVPVNKVWMIFVMGIPGQALISTWSFVRKHEKKRKLLNNSASDSADSNSFDINSQNISE